MEKIIFIKGKNLGGMDVDDVNSELSAGWKIKNVFPQRVSYDGGTGYGGYLIVLIK